MKMWKLRRHEVAGSIHDCIIQKRSKKGLDRSTREFQIDHNCCRALCARLPFWYGLPLDWAWRRCVRRNRRWKNRQHCTWKSTAPSAVLLESIFSPEDCSKSEWATMGVWHSRCLSWQNAELGSKTKCTSFRVSRFRGSATRAKYVVVSYANVMHVRRLQVLSIPIRTRRKVRALCSNVTKLYPHTPCTVLTYLCHVCADAHVNFPQQRRVAWRPVTPS